MSSHAWEELLESPEQVITLLGGGLTHRCLCMSWGFCHLEGSPGTAADGSCDPTFGACLPLDLGVLCRT